MVSHEKRDQKECGSYRGMPMVAHAGKIMLEIIARCFSEVCERVRFGILQEKQSGFRPDGSTIDMMLFVICQLQ